MALRAVVILLHAVLAVGIRLNNDRCTPLKSGTKIYLKSNLLDDHFITAKEKGDCGKLSDQIPYSLKGDYTLDESREKRLTCGSFHLQKGMSKNTTFKIVSKKKTGEAIVSGEEVKLVMEKDGETHPYRHKSKDVVDKEVREMSIDFGLSAKEWPYVTALEKKGTDLEIQKARNVDISHGPIAMAQTFDTVHQDTHAGEPICSGDQIFMRTSDANRAFQPFAGPLKALAGKCGGDSSVPCPYLYMQGDSDGVIGFHHHFPGASGDPSGVREQKNWVAVDPYALANTFTIIPEDETVIRHRRRETKE